MIIDIEEIKLLLPHRYPFLFLDKCEIIEIGKKGVGHRKFLPNEYFFKGHFPNKPIVPGVVLIESLAQTAGVVVAKGFSSNSKNTVLFMSISNAKFRKPVIPNDTISLEVSILKNVKIKQHILKDYGQAQKKTCLKLMLIEKKFIQL